ncbi:galactokinase, partial [Bacillus safensis]|uniref:galactokinase n=1 Tax=Bacillus safensis TaxID=561879 RepID=UPI00364F4B5D
GHALLLDSSAGSVEAVPFDPAESGVAVLVIDTRTRHRLVDGQYARRRTSVEDAAGRLGVASLRDVADTETDVGILADPELVRRARHVVTEIRRVREALPLLKSGRIRDIGPLVSASHVSLRDDFEVSCPELDSAVDAALAAGSYGARMTGGGFGGSAIALVESSDVDQVAREVQSAARSRGFAPPAFLRLDTGSGPAERLY